MMYDAAAFLCFMTVFILVIFMLNHIVNICRKGN